MTAAITTLGKRNLEHVFKEPLKTLSFQRFFMGARPRVLRTIVGEMITGAAVCGGAGGRHNKLGGRHSCHKSEVSKITNLNHG